MAIITTSQNLPAVTYPQAETLEIRNGATLTISTAAPLIFNLHDMDHDLRFEAGGVLEIRGAPIPRP